MPCAQHPVNLTGAVPCAQHPLSPAGAAPCPVLQACQGCPPCSAPRELWLPWNHGSMAMPVPHGAGRWQKAVSGSCCPPGELAPVPVPPSRSAGRCFWHFLLCAFFWPEFSQCHLELPCGWSHGVLPQVPRTEPGTAMQPQPPAQLWVAQKGRLKLGTVPAVPSLHSSGHTKASHKLLLSLKHHKP